MDYMTILYALFAALIYGGSFYIKNRASTGEEFDPLKLFSTLLVAVLISIIALVTGSPLTQEDLFSQLIAYGGIIIMVETWLKTLWRGAKGQAPSATPKKARK